jgi:glycosyltransferase involved in cell wall biosynthesis
VITRLINGGADENTVLSCNHAAHLGHDVVLIHGADAHDEIQATVSPKVKIVRIERMVRPLSPMSDLSVLLELVRHFRRFKPHIVHTHTSKAGILGRAAARLSRVPIIVHGVHIVPFDNVSNWERALYLGAERAVQGITDAYIDVSSGMRDLCLEARIGTSDRHHVIHSGFDVGRFRVARPPDDWRGLLGVGATEPKPPVLLMIAAFERRKRHLEFLDSFPKIVATMPNVRLVFVGDGRLRSEIDSKIARLGLSRNVILTGFRRDPERWIALADVCIHTSSREGLPRVVIQYLANGKPCVVSDLPGLSEVVKHGFNGLVAPPGRLDMIAEAAARLLEDEGLRRRLTHGSIVTDLSKWEATRMGDQIEAVYRSLIRKSPPNNYKSNYEAIQA